MLLQKLKKYELPELPAPRHDPELLTAEQLQAYKKIGFRNRNYVPVGVRGVFGGVVQNMHMHWKFHETVQVCCDNFPKEKIKEMAAMLTRLSGGIVINIHNTKTIIMFRGRNYRQPKNLIPFNTLTKRKVSPMQLMSLSQFAFPCYFHFTFLLLWIMHMICMSLTDSYRVLVYLCCIWLTPMDHLFIFQIDYLQLCNTSKWVQFSFLQALFKARFEQALESQKLNIKKIETQLRRKGISPEDPVAMASIQRVASTFFRAIDEQQGTPYIFHGDAQPSAGTTEIKEPHDQPSEDSDQEELDRFISEIESAAEKQWEEEEAAEKEESSRMRYWEREEVGERRGFVRSYENSDYEDRGQGRYRRENNNRRTSDARKWDDDSEAEASGEEWDSGDDVDDRDNFLGFDNDRDSRDKHPRRFESMRNGMSRSSGRRDFVPRGEVGERRGFNRSYGNSDVQDRGQGRYRRDNNKGTSDARRWDDDSEIEASGKEWHSGDDTDNFLGFDNDRDAPDDHPLRFKNTRNEKSRSSGRQSSIPGGFRGSNRSPGNLVSASDSNDGGLDSEEEDLWGPDNKGGETNLRSPEVNFSNFHSSSEEDSNDNLEHGDTIGKMKKNTDESWDSD